ncbi:hypothetical protein [Kumtagia ephedrae]|uniref:Uncharacterized protein n=1 Tax=Kumtagia ephedrae TaxID=2116701 RepID=A0A2P7RHW3_9HYPH|nr:hypothetical protein [Mesorhizobium ephedrae]PSJ49828.1 hypothetical protein C7I84_29135 [Mesorhizobium ephedrae]
MVAQPLIEEISGGPAGAMISGLAGLGGTAAERPSHEERIEKSMSFEAAALSFTAWRKLGIAMVIFAVPLSAGRNP